MEFLGYEIMSERVPCRWGFGEDKQSKEGIVNTVSGVVCMLGLILGLTRRRRSVKIRAEGC